MHREIDLLIDTIENKDSQQHRKVDLIWEFYSYLYHKFITYYLS